MRMISALVFSMKPRSLPPPRFDSSIHCCVSSPAHTLCATPGSPANAGCNAGPACSRSWDRRRHGRRAKTGRLPRGSASSAVARPRRSLRPPRIGPRPRSGGSTAIRPRLPAPGRSDNRMPGWGSPSRGRSHLSRNPSGSRRRPCCRGPSDWCSPKASWRPGLIPPVVPSNCKRRGERGGIHVCLALVPDDVHSPDVDGQTEHGEHGDNTDGDGY